MDMNKAVFKEIRQMETMEEAGQSTVGKQTHQGWKTPLPSSPLHLDLHLR
jgi:hypothetical protein